MADGKKLRANAVTQVSDFVAGSPVMTISVPKSGSPDFVVRFGQWSDAVREQALFEGVKKRLINMAALGDNATPAEKYAEIKRAADHYASGSDDWRIPSIVTGPKLDPIILAAIGEVLGKPVDAIRAMVAKNAAERKVAEPDYLVKLGTGASVAPVVARMREEAAAKRAESVDVDADAELAAMEEDDGEE